MSGGVVQAVEKGMVVLPKPAVGKERAMYSTSTKLQFGHGWATVENVAICPAAGELVRSFNSATAWRPWKTDRIREQQAGKERPHQVPGREGHQQDPKIAQALAELRGKAPFVKIFGSYPAAVL